MEAPNITTVRRALMGITCGKRSIVATPGSKCLLTLTNLRTLDSARKRLIKKGDGECEVQWGDIAAALSLKEVESCAPCMARWILSYSEEAAAGSAPAPRAPTGAVESVDEEA